MAGSDIVSDGNGNALAKDNQERQAGQQDSDCGCCASHGDPPMLYIKLSV
jgi:hypothetical protein